MLDGFPRDENQEHACSGTCPDAVQPQIVVLLDVPADECRRRLLARAPIEERTDDTAETIDRRLAAFDRDLRPVIDAYRRRENLVRVDVDADRSDVTERILDRLTCP